MNRTVTWNWPRTQTQVSITVSKISELSCTGPFNRIEVSNVCVL